MICFFFFFLHLCTTLWACCQRQEPDRQTSRVADLCFKDLTIPKCLLKLWNLKLTQPLVLFVSLFFHISQSLSHPHTTPPHLQTFLCNRKGKFFLFVCLITAYIVCSLNGCNQSVFESSPYLCDWQQSWASSFYVGTQAVFQILPSIKIEVAMRAVSWEVNIWIRSLLIQGSIPCCPHAWAGIAGAGSCQLCAVAIQRRSCSPGVGAGKARFSHQQGLERRKPFPIAQGREVGVAALM